MGTLIALIRSSDMNRPTTRDLIVFTLLVAFGVAARVGLQHIPNFAPVAAIALFAGYFLGHRLLAVCTPLAIMLISDRLVDAGGYAWPLMLTVYGLLAVPVLLGTPLRGWMNLAGNTSLDSSLRTVLGLVGCSLTCSFLFFVGTNFAVWATSSWYEPTMAGLAKCYLSAIPFFRYTVTGDALFATVLFGSYAMVLRSVPSAEQVDARMQSSN